MELDLRTLLAAGAMVAMTIGIAMFFIQRTQKSNTGFNSLFQGFAAAAVGALLGALRGLTPDFLSIVVGNVLIGFWMTMVWRSVRISCVMRFPAMRVWMSIVALGGVLGFYTYVQFDTGMRIVVLSLYLAVFAALSARDLFVRLSQTDLGVAYKFTSQVLTWFAVIMCLRAVLTVMTETPTYYMDVGIVQQALVMAMIAMYVSLAVGFLWIWQRRREDNLQKRAEDLHAAHQLTDQLRAQAEQAALHDPLTSAGNRRKFHMVAEMERERHIRHGHDLSVAFMDVDHFKMINDAYGHDVGDDVLRSLVLHLSDITRNIDLIYRWGGEEFAILMPETNLPMACEVSNRIRQHVEENIKFGEKPVTISVGVTQLRNQETVNNLIERADQLMYTAKDRGRNCVIHG